MPFILGMFSTPLMAAVSGTGMGAAAMAAYDWYTVESEAEGGSSPATIIQVGSIAGSPSATTDGGSSGGGERCACSPGVPWWALGVAGGLAGLWYLGDGK